MIDDKEESQLQVNSLVLPPQAASSRTSIDDTDMTHNGDGNNGGESTSYETLVKEIVLQQWTKDYDDTLEEYLTIIGKAKDFPDAKAINFRRKVICDVVVAAFKGNQEMISKAKNANKTATALVVASLNFLKHHQERLEIENELSLHSFLSILCMYVLREYYKRTKEQALLRPVVSRNNNRMVPVNYLISKTELSHEYDVQKFVHQAERVAKWFDASEDSVNASEYEDAPYFCVVQSSGMGKTKLIYEGCKELEQKDNWSCHTVLPWTLKDSNALTNGDVFSHRLNIEVCATKKSAVDAATAALAYLNTFCDKLIAEEASDHDGNQRTIFLCFDEAHVYLESHKFQDDEGAENVKHPAFLFRCIRLWLRQKKGRHKVIGCFSGTLATLASFRLEADPQLSVPSSRDFTSIGERYNFYEKGAKVFPIFVQTTTMGCLGGRNLEGDQGLDKHTTEYRQAIRHGRPLFELMEENGDLARNEGSVVRRMLLYGLGNHWAVGKESLKSCLSILGTRVQMGQPSFSVASDMVGYGYANLTHATSTDAIICYMPDPVCGRLAMQLMDSEWALGDIKGRPSSWWLWQMKEIFSQGLCRPEQGDFGEVMVALYFLVCADVLRRQDNHNHTTFSVSLEDWIENLTTGGLERRQGHRSDEYALPKRKSKRLLAAKLPVSGQKQAAEKLDETMDDADEVGVEASISCIQVCQNYLRSCEADWEGFCSQDFLSYMYASGTAFYVFPGCPIIDLVIPIKLSGQGKDYFAPMVISIKSRAYYSPEDARWECQRMTERFKRVEEGDDKEAFEFFPGALCLLVVFGSTAVSNDDDLTLDRSAISELSKKNIVSRVLHIPEEDAFGGFCDTFRTLTSEIAFGSSEVFASHSFVRAYCKDENTEELDSRAALRSSPGLEESELLRNLHEQFKNGYGASGMV
ncbi:unnamed protein product [Cylindrotheca closterium]|uniref:Uncharacterized protein n=1 Tax=Cylindrotheca closterium TaxID=2856 RepID=A0AAD2CEB7_9STRA|nr:unnamed protein product [Cylindrotheca closterium]